MALPYQQPVPGIPQRQPPPAQPPRPQSQTYTRNDFESSTPRTVYQAPKQAPSGPGAPKPPAPTTDYLRNPTPATTGALQMQAYAPPQRAQVNYGQAGNAANSAQGRAPAFTSTMTDPFGQPTTPQQFYPQQDAFVSQLLGQMGQIPGGTWLGQGAPPPDFGRRPQMDFGQMWGNAGQMVDQGFTNPFSPGMAAPIQPPPQGTPYQPGFGGGLPDAAPISFMRPTAGPVQPAPSLYMPNYSREPAWITRPGMPEYPPIPDTPFMDPRLQSVVDQRTAREDRLRRQGWRDRPVGPGFAQPIPEPPAGDPYRPFGPSTPLPEYNLQIRRQWAEEREMARRAPRAPGYKPRSASGYEAAGLKLPPVFSPEWYDMVDENQKENVRHGVYPHSLY